MFSSTWTHIWRVENKKRVKASQTIEMCAYVGEEKTFIFCSFCFYYSFEESSTMSSTQKWVYGSGRLYIINEKAFILRFGLVNLRSRSWSSIRKLHKTSAGGKRRIFVDKRWGMKAVSGKQKVCRKFWWRNFQFAKFFDLGYWDSELWWKCSIVS